MIQPIVSLDYNRPYPSLPSSWDCVLFPFAILLRKKGNALFIECFCFFWLFCVCVCVPALGVLRTPLRVSLYLSRRACVCLCVPGAVCGVVSVGFWTHPSETGQPRSFGEAFCLFWRHLQKACLMMYACCIMVGYCFWSFHWHLRPSALFHSPVFEYSIHPTFP